MTKLAGSCICGLVSFEILGEFSDFYMCHCHRCQKITGSAHAANIFSDSGSITWLSGENEITSFTLSGAKYFNHNFCSNCGSPVPRKARSGEFLIIPAGSLDSDPIIAPQRNIFWENRASWYDAGCMSKKYRSDEK